MWDQSYILLGLHKNKVMQITYCRALNKPLAGSFSYHPPQLSSASVNVHLYSEQDLMVSELSFTL